jgi:hypothetical protein
VNHGTNSLHPNNPQITVLHDTYAIKMGGERKKSLPLITDVNKIIEKNLRVAEHLRASVTVFADASEVTSAAQNPDLFTKVLSTHVATLQTQSKILEFLAQDEQLGESELAEHVEAMTKASRKSLKNARKLEEHAKVSDFGIYQAAMRLGEDID